VEFLLIALPVGSKGSAASSGKSDPSEWLRSADDAGVRAKEAAGYRKRAAPNSTQWNFHLMPKRTILATL